MTTLQQSMESLKRIGISFGKCEFRTGVPDPEGQMRSALAELVRDPVWLPEYGEIAEWLADNRERGLLLTGQTGLGKTVMATKVIPVILHANLGVIARPVSAYDMNRRERELEGRSLIVLDDIGVEDDKSDYGERRRVFADIVDRAERRGDTLIITTNLTSKNIAARYGERTADRLRALTRLVVLRGGSLRNRQTT